MKGFKDAITCVQKAPGEKKMGGQVKEEKVGPILLKDLRGFLGSEKAGGTMC